MKRIYVVIILLLLIPLNVFASESFSVNKKELTLELGRSTEIKVTAKNSAGRLDVLSSNNEIASVSTKSLFLDNNSETIKIKANGIGETAIVITATSNYATYDEDILEGEKQEIKVHVIKKDSNHNSLDGDDIKVPDTGSRVSCLAILFGVLLIVIPSILIYKKRK